MSWLVGSSTAVAQDISAKDFDLACAVTASAVVASPKGAVERDTAMWLWSFYLDRLSGRDDKTFWAMVIKGRLDQSEPPTILAANTGAAHAEAEHQ